MTDELDLIKDVASRLTKAGIEYMITGSIAMAVYATPRMTRDIDVIIQVTPEDAGKIIDLFREDFYIDENSVGQAVLNKGMFNIIHNESIIKVDFIVRKDEEYRVLEFSRRQKIDLEGEAVSVVAPEDLILSKLVWAKQSEGDTTPEMQKRLSAMIAARSPEERLRMASSMFDTGRTLLRAGLKKQNGALGEEQLRAQVFLRLYGEDFTDSEVRQIIASNPQMKLETDS